MAFIYQIINDIIDKIYVGKTEFSIEKRFKEHCQDAFKRTNEKRPLYAAMRKYGIENFHIELIEETNNPEEREKFWIAEKDSFKNGYNATMGGDGKKWIDDALVIQTYLQLQSVIETANTLKHDPHIISNILKNNNIKVLSSSEVSKNTRSIAVGMYDKNTEELLKTFSSYTEAATWLRETGKTNCKLSSARTHIGQVCNGVRKTASGYIWKNI